MVFQTIDDKSECIGIYTNGKLYFENFPDGLSQTWKYTGSLATKQVEYAWLYTGGFTLERCCPLNLQEELRDTQKKMNAYIKSFKIAKVNLNEHCIFDLVPHDFLMQFCELKNKITAHVFETYKKPSNYEHLVEVHKLLQKIKYQKLNLSVSDSRHLMHSSLVRTKIQTLLKSYNYIDYNLFGTVTGRLTTSPDSFPILTLKKELRQIVKPHNDLFLSLDYNGAEVRTLLDLSGQPQPCEDIHEWNANNLFENPIEREECKKRFFAWLYDPTSTDIDTTVYSKEKVLDKWYEGGYISTPYGRKIEVEERKALNYLIQSTTADRVLSKAVMLDEALSDCKSFISHIVHDEIVIDYHDEDRAIVLKLKEMFEDGYAANLKAGKDYYNLSEMQL